MDELLGNRSRRIAEGMSDELLFAMLTTQEVGAPPVLRASSSSLTPGGSPAAAAAGIQSTSSPSSTAISRTPKEDSEIAAFAAANNLLYSGASSSSAPGTPRTPPRAALTPGHHRRGLSSSSSLSSIGASVHPHHHHHSSSSSSSPSHRLAEQQIQTRVEFDENGLILQPRWDLLLPPPKDHELWQTLRGTTGREERMRMMQEKDSRRMLESPKQQLAVPNPRPGDTEASLAILIHRCVCFVVFFSLSLSLSCLLPFSLPIVFFFRFVRVCVSSHVEEDIRYALVIDRYDEPDVLFSQPVPYSRRFIHFEEPANLERRQSTGAFTASSLTSPAPESGKDDPFSATASTTQTAFNTFTPTQTFNERLDAAKKVCCWFFFLSFLPVSIIRLLTAFL